MNDTHLYIAIGLPVAAVLTSLTVSLVQVSAIREDIREIRSGLKHKALRKNNMVRELDFDAETRSRGGIAEEDRERKDKTDSRELAGSTSGSGSRTLRSGFTPATARARAGRGA